MGNKNKQKRVKKCYLGEMLSITMGYMFVPQGRVREIVEHITGENGEDAPMPLLLHMAQNYLKWKFPELESGDLDELHMKIVDVPEGEEEKQTKDEIFSSWLALCKAKGMDKRYMIKPMSNKVYSDIVAHILSADEDDIEGEV